MSAVNKQTIAKQSDLIEEMGKAAKKAAYTLSQTSTEAINAVLLNISKNLIAQQIYLIEENKKDLIKAEQKGLSPALIDRLTLSAERVKALSDSVLKVIDLDDPTGKILWSQERPNGLKIHRKSCPIGVLGMIYESRPNVTIDAAILCLKSHNAVILRGGSESINSALALHKIIQDSLHQENLPKECVSMIPSSDRILVGEMLKANKYIDVMIPRGGKSLIERVMTEARMPVFGHLEGLCHIYIDLEADISMAKDVSLNAKMRRTGICGAMETLLIHKGLGKENAQEILSNLIDNGCTIYGDAHASKIDHRILKATEEDWTTEYLDSKLSVRFVNSCEEAIDHINTYGSHHTDSIVTNNADTALYFQNNVDSGIVMHNASTQFADGGEFGMGAEIGIATGKMHARGPVGLEQLCSYKYFVHGNGHTRPK